MGHRTLPELDGIEHDSPFPDTILSIWHNCNRAWKRREAPCLQIVMLRVISRPGYSTMPSPRTDRLYSSILRRSARSAFKGTKIDTLEVGALEVSLQKRRAVETV